MEPTEITYAQGLRSATARTKTIRLKTIGVKKLFSRFTYQVPLNNSEGITILTAPNGFGKSTLLRMTRDMLAGDYQSLAAIPFESFRLEFDNGSILEAVRPSSSRTGRSVIAEITLAAPGKKVIKYRPPTPDDIDEVPFIPLHLVSSIADGVPYLRQVGPATWRDEAQGRLLDSRDVLAIYGESAGFRFASHSPEPARLAHLRERLAVTYIPADRLNVSITHAQGRTSNRNTRRIAAVDEINDSMRQQVSDSISKYARASHKVDSDFTKRILPELNRPTPKIPKPEQLDALRGLEERVRFLETRFQRLGLLEGTERQGLADAVKTGSAFTVLRRHLEDIETKLGELSQVAARMELLQSFLSDSFTFKNIEFSQREGIKIVSDEGQQLSLQSLSSGEQHLLVLFGRLLFGDRVPLVLLDEPEISLHLDWQQRFLQYLEQVFRVQPFDLVIATHSPSLIGGRWELTCELAEQM